MRTILTVINFSGVSVKGKEEEYLSDLQNVIIRTNYLIKFYSSPDGLSMEILQIFDVTIISSNNLDSVRGGACGLAGVHPCQNTHIYHSISHCVIELPYKQDTV